MRSDPKRGKYLVILRSHLIRTPSPTLCNCTKCAPSSSISWSDGVCRIDRRGQSRCEPAWRLRAGFSDHLAYAQRTAHARALARCSRRGSCVECGGRQDAWTDPGRTSHARRSTQDLRSRCGVEIWARPRRGVRSIDFFIKLFPGCPRRLNPRLL